MILIICSAVFSVLSFYQKTFTSTQLKTDMYENIRGATELMTQEIGQSGLASLPALSPTLTANVTGSPASQTVAVSAATGMFVGEMVSVDAGTPQEMVSLTAVNPVTSQVTGIFNNAHSSGTTITVSPELTASVTGSSSVQTVTVNFVTSMFVGEKLLVDAGSSEELVVITALDTSANKISGIFTLSHSIGTPINVLGVFPSGVMSSSTATQLRLFGDINADGSLVYVHYDCDILGGKLTRSVTTVAPGTTTSNSGQILLNTLLPNPGGAACFQYATVTAGTYTFVTKIAITMTVRTTTSDPQTGAYKTLTKTLRDLAPRNVLFGLELANVPLPDRLQPTPPNLPLS